MKTFDRKDIYTIATVEDAKKYVGKLGYPSNSLSKLKQLVNNFTPYSLDKIEIDNDKPFFYKNDSFLFFLPADKVKEVEEKKKYRPFKTIEEFFDIYKKNIGSLITYRVKANPLREITTSIMGYIKEANLEDQLQIGGGTLKLSIWYEITEIWDEDKESWLPFGIEE